MQFAQSLISIAAALFAVAGTGNGAALETVSRIHHSIPYRLLICRIEGCSCRVLHGQQLSGQLREHLPVKWTVCYFWVRFQRPGFQHPRPEWNHLHRFCVSLVIVNLCMDDDSHLLRISDNGCSGRSLFIGSDVAALGDFNFNDVISSFSCSG